ncbi:MAG TPA: glycosyltransferase family 2 protein [Candidatus Paceibacterota bacterium]
MNRSVSIVIPAYNEETKLAPTVDFVLAGLNKNNISDFEILIFNDASTDRTGEVADELAKKYHQIRVIHNSKNMNLGFNFIRGIELAAKEFVGMVPGDNEMDPETLDNVFNALGKADIVMTYIQNTKVRPWGRRFLSATYTAIINISFGFKMRYYNGCCFFKTAMAKKVPVSTYGFAYMMEILVKLLKSGATYVEAPMINRVRARGATKAFRIKNILSVFKTFLTLFWAVQILRKRIKLN